MKNLKKEIEKLQQEMIDDSWNYHKDVLEEIDCEEKGDIVSRCLELEGDEYTGTAWELGYIYALGEALRILNKYIKK